MRAPPAQLGMVEEISPETPWRDIPFAVIDTETTGKDPARGDRIVEIAVVHFDHGVVTARHSALVNPGIPIPAEAAAVHGITDDKVKGEPKFGKRSCRSSAGGWRGGFRWRTTPASTGRSSSRRCARRGTPPAKNNSVPAPMRMSTEWIDPLVWARALQATAKGFKLGEVAARAGIELVNAHRATDDSEAAGQVFFALLAQESAMTYRTLVSRQRGLIAGGPGRPPWRR